MATFSARAILSGDAAGAVRSIQLTKNQFKKLAKQKRNNTKAAKGLKGAWGAIAAAGAAVVGVAAGIAKAFAASVQQFSAFETKFAEITTLFNGSQAALQGMRAAIEGVGDAFGVDNIQAAEAYYQIVSAGAAAGAEANYILEAAAKAAIGGVTDIKTAADGLTTVLNAYKLEAEESERVSDLLFATVKGGKTTFAELSANIGKVAPIASSSGVALETLLAAIQEITKQGVTSAEAMTQMKALIQSMINPSKQAADIMKELGVDWGAAALEANGLQAQIQALNEATGGNAEQITKVLGSIESYQGYVVLAADDTKAFGAAIDETTASLGATDEAVEKMSNTLGFQTKRVTANWQSIKTAVGEALAESLNMTTATGGIADAMNHLKPILVAVASAIGQGIAAAIQWMVDGVKQAINAYRDWKPLLDLVVFALRNIWSMIKLVVKLVFEWGKLWFNVVTGIIKLIGKLIQGLVWIGKTIFEALFGPIEEVQGKFQAVMDVLGSGFKWLGETLGKIGGFFRDAFTGWITWVINKIRGFLETIDRLLSAVGIKTNLKGAMDGVLLAIESGSKLVADNVVKAWNWAGEKIKEGTKGTRDALTTFADEVIGNSKTLLSELSDLSWDFGGGQKANSTLRWMHEAAKKAVEMKIAMGDFLGNVETVSDGVQNELAPGLDMAYGFSSSLVMGMTNTEARIIQAATAAGGLNRELKNADDNTQKIKRSWGDIARDAKEGIKSINWSGFLEQGIRAAIDGDRDALKGLFTDLGGELGQALGTAIGGPVGGVIGKILGEVVGDKVFDLLESIGDKLFSSSDRVTVGVSATGQFHSALTGRQATGASGLRLAAQHRGAGDEGAAIADAMLDQFLEIDRKLTGIFRSLGASVDLSGVSLGTGRASPRNPLRPSATHDPFGSVAIDQVIEEDIKSAALDFLKAWVEVVKKELPTALQAAVDSAVAAGESVGEVLSNLTQVIVDNIDNLDLANIEVKEVLEGLRDVEQQRYDDLVGAVQGFARLADITKDFDNLIPQPALTGLARLRELAGKTAEALTEFQGVDPADIEATRAATEGLTNAMLEQKSVAMQLLETYAQINDSVSSTIGGLRTEIQESLLTDVEKNRRDRQRLLELRDLIPTLTDPAAVQEAVRESTEIARRLWATEADAIKSRYEEIRNLGGVVAPGEMEAALGAVADKYLNILDDIETGAKSAIQLAVQAVIDAQKETAEKVGASITTATDKFDTAIDETINKLTVLNTALAGTATTIQESGTDFVIASGQFSTSVLEFGTHVESGINVNVTVNDGSEGEVNA